MGKVLLAVNGATPDTHAFQYALDLCKRIKADLNVLQIVGSREFGGYLARLKQAADKARFIFESSMAAAAFAESGEFESAKQLLDEAERNMRQLLPQAAAAGIRSELIISSGKSEEVIVDYVRENKDIVIAVYDAGGDGSKPKNDRRIKKELQSLTNKLSVPVVVVPAP